MTTVLRTQAPIHFGENRPIPHGTGLFPCAKYNFDPKTLLEKIGGVLFDCLTLLLSDNIISY